MHRTRTRRTLAITLIALTAVLVAACSSGAASTPASGAVEGAVGGDPTIAIAVPSDGADVTVPFDVQLESSVALGEPETGNQHAHLYFDTTTDSADYDIVYGTTAQVTRQLTPGQHTIIVALANPDHSLAGPTGQITVNVTGAGGGAESAAPDAESAAPPPIGY